MINKPKGYDEAAIYEEYECLPIGGYILEIQDVEKTDNCIVLKFDIAEGQYKDFFKKQYLNNQNEDKKWKGNYRIWLPRDDGSEQDNWSIRRLKTIMNTFEENNSGFRWEWDETKLKGLKIGALFNQKEYDFNGKQGFFTNCKKLISVEKIHNGTYQIPGTDYLNGKPQENIEGFERLNDGDIPF